ncbi:hypothetical protein KFK09_000891 [Dendrobium nobile]|uniref:WRKY domain-containing protein n=1 Tax=Dendrobium nobile TaxID=94219 RepID=A0A8T3C9U7_DENNO|nr:hypothetical protein KFK09_000891 [Dendrobium nobile]
MASSNMGHRDALNELARGQEVKERLRSILRLSPAGGGGGVEMPSVFVSLDEPVAPAVIAAPASSGGGDQGESSSDGKAGSAGQENNRKKSHSWTTSSCAPYDDGFQWRKYGEKKISKSKFTRSYYRCAYRDEQGCLATKQVQQKEMEDPPMFLVTCSNEHTCNCLSSLFLTEQSPVACSMNLHF